jgi:hypothetical protein
MKEKRFYSDPEVLIEEISNLHAEADLVVEEIVNKMNELALVEAELFEKYEKEYLKLKEQVNGEGMKMTEKELEHRVNNMLLDLKIKQILLEAQVDALSKKLRWIESKLSTIQTILNYHEEVYRDLAKL